MEIGILRDRIMELEKSNEDLELLQPMNKTLGPGANGTDGGAANATAANATDANATNGTAPHLNRLEMLRKKVEELERQEKDEERKKREDAMEAKLR